MFQTAPGVTVPFPEKLREEYQRFEQVLRANVSYEHLFPLVREFCRGLEEPLFFVLQLPLDQREEEAYGDGELHQKVMYLDGLKTTDADGILQAYGEVLFQDGMCQFGIASQVSREEIFVQQYKLTDIFAPDPEKYVSLLERYGLTEVEELTTAWDTFSQESPGECRLVKVNGTDVYDVARALEERGMYVAKIIEG